MKLKKKLATVVAMAAIFSSIAAPITAKAECNDHYWLHDDTIYNSYTQQHGYFVGEDETKNCVITTYITEYIFKCKYCFSSKLNCSDYICNILYRCKTRKCIWR